jgi:hypothetical protein
MKLDNAAKLLTFSFINIPTSPAGSNNSGPIYVTDDAIYFQYWESWTWRTVAKLDNEGSFITGLDLVHCTTNEELFA